MMQTVKCPAEFSPVSKCGYNKSGRPSIDKIIKFSPQPKSLLIAEMINQMKTKECRQRKGNAATDSEKPEDGKNKVTSQRKCSKLYLCDYPECSYSCKLSCNLIKHKRTHTSEKPYLCDQCTFRSNFVNSLKTHKRVHTVERPYACKYCNYRCNSSSNLKKHCLHRHPEVPKT